MKHVTKMILVVLLFSCAPGKELTISSLNTDELSSRQDNDLAAVRIYRKGLRSILIDMKKRPKLFPARKRTTARMFNRDDKQELMSIWMSVLDYYYALDSLDRFHRDFEKLSGSVASKSYHISRSAFYTKYRFALEFLSLAGNDPTFDVIYNEELPELGLPGKTYEGFKYRYLNVFRATEFAAFEAIAGTFKSLPDKELSKETESDGKYIWEFGKGKGEAMTAANGLNILKGVGKETWFPVQKGVADMMGDIKVYRQHKYLISYDQIEEMGKDLQPGDILLERREWYLSNIGMPGFWTHAALYIGTPEERKAFFDDPSVKEWLAKKGAGDSEEYLSRVYKEAYARSVRPDEGRIPKIVEAIGEGVLFTTLEYSAHCDSLAVLRPRLSKKDRLAAIARGFKYSGRPYDFDFDFLTDATLVCTELVYKAYEKTAETAGLSFKLQKILGKLLLSANDIAVEYDKEYNTNKQDMDFVLFYDGFEKSRDAKRSDEKEFRASWKRPKWHVLVQE